MSVVGQILYIAVGIFLAFLWVRFIMDWVQVFARSWAPRGVLLVVLEVVYSATDPPIKALRRVIPPLRIGNFALDLSFLIVMVATYLVWGVLRGLAY